MKKLLPAIIAIVLVTAVALTACGKKNNNESNNKASTTLKSTTNMSQAADEFGEDMKTTLDEMKSDVEEMMPGNNDRTDTSTKSAD